MDSNFYFEMEEDVVINYRIGWKKLQKYHLNPPIISFPKGIEIYNQYLNFRQNLSISLFEYLNNLLFSQNDLLVIRRADFPYFVSEYIIHMIIWINPILNFSIDDRVITDYLKLKGYRNFILFENIMVNRSVPTIRHYHFFVNKI